MRRATGGSGGPGPQKIAGGIVTVGLLVGGAVLVNNSLFNGRILSLVMVRDCR